MKSLILFAFLSFGCAEFKCGADVKDGETVDGNMCNNRVERTMSVSSYFTASQKEMIRDAGQMWFDATNGTVKLTFTEHLDNNTDILFDTNLGPNNIGSTHPSDGKLHLNGSIIVDDHFREVVIHELGHSFGLGHSHNPLTDMYYLENGIPYITQEDVDHFNAVKANGIFDK